MANQGRGTFTCCQVTRHPKPNFAAHFAGVPKNKRCHLARQFSWFTSCLVGCLQQPHDQTAVTSLTQGGRHAIAFLAETAPKAASRRSKVQFLLTAYTKQEGEINRPHCYRISKQATSKKFALPI